MKRLLIIGALMLMLQGCGNSPAQQAHDYCWETRAEDVKAMNRIHNDMWEDILTLEARIIELEKTSP